jgi:hypothetical protein
MIEQLICHWTDKGHGPSSPMVQTIIRHQRKRSLELQQNEGACDSLGETDTSQLFGGFSHTQREIGFQS